MWPWLIALGILVVAWVLPLPGLVFGEEQLAASRMPETRATVQSASESFQKAQSAYKQYVATHDMGAVLSSVQKAIAEARANSSDPAALAALRAALGPVQGYLGVLHGYAAAGDAYFAALRAYDDNLMAWSRALSPASQEELRPDTWPFVEYLKRYPPPDGETPDPPKVTAQDVATQTTSLAAHVAALDPQAAVGSTQAAIDAIGRDISGIWASGRSVERIESLHNEYYRLLKVYDARLQQVAAQDAANQGPQSRRALATVLDLGVGLVLLGGLAALFMPRAGEARRS